MISERPKSFRTLYKTTKDRIEKQYEDLYKENELLIAETISSFSHIKEDINDYNNALNLDLNKYEEFKCNGYITGRFLNKLQTIIKETDKTDSEYSIYLSIVYKLAVNQKTIYDNRKLLNKYSKLLLVNFKEFLRYLRIYMNVVHKKMIVDGFGYRIHPKIGNIVIVRVTTTRKLLDTKATKENKERLIAEGKTPYNKEEAKFCKENGLEYNGIDYRIFKQDTHCYKIVRLAGSFQNTNGIYLSFTATDSRPIEYRGKTNEDILEDVNNDVDKLMNSNCDLRTKLNLYLKLKPNEYYKYIRNDSQK